MVHYAKIRLCDIDVDSFWSQVDRRGSDDCWLWQGTRDKDDYGYLSVKGRSRKAHRVSFLLKHRHLNRDLQVCHTCDTPRCVNPNHLWQGTNQQNCDDMVAKRRSLFGVRNPRAKLKTADPIKAIALLEQGLSQKEVAKKLGCKQITVSNIWRGRQWGKITGRQYSQGCRLGSCHPRAVLNEATARRINNLSSKGDGATEIARRLNLKIPTVYSVISGQTWSHVTGVNCA